MGSYKYFIIIKEPVSKVSITTIKMYIKGNPKSTLEFMHFTNYPGKNHSLWKDDAYKVYRGCKISPNPLNGNTAVFIDYLRLEGQKKISVFSCLPKTLIIKNKPYFWYAVYHYVFILRQNNSCTIKVHKKSNKQFINHEFDQI